jgi:hypothetical protein
MQGTSQANILMCNVCRVSGGLPLEEVVALVLKLLFGIAQQPASSVREHQKERKAHTLHDFPRHFLGLKRIESF